jgi:hypothetical protein
MTLAVEVAAPRLRCGDVTALDDLTFTSPAAGLRAAGPQRRGRTSVLSVQAGSARRPAARC